MLCVDASSSSTSAPAAEVDAPEIGVEVVEDVVVGLCGSLCEAAGSIPSGCCNQ